MLDDLIGTYGERLVVAVIGLGVAFAVLIAVLWLVRRRGGPAPFLKGGRNRQPRLQVLDATAVDARRRLVLVRRDNVEHLIMIGGPTDIVVESGIGAIPIVTDITGEQQGALEHQATKALSEHVPAPVPVPVPVPVPERDSAPLAVPQPALKKRETVPGEQRITPVQLAPEPAAVQSPIATPKVQAPVPASPAEPIKIEGADQPLKPVIPARPTDHAVRTQSRPSDEAPQPLTPKHNPPPVHTAETVKPSNSPLLTSAMRSGAPAAAATVAATPSVAVNNQSKPFSADITVTQQPVINQQVDDFFSAARERVLPDLAAPETVPAKDPGEKSPAIDDRFSAELRDDFESFLNAEIEKNNASQFDGAIDSPERRSDVKPPITGASVDSDAQKEMARIFGEMSVKRD